MLPALPLLELSCLRLEVFLPSFGLVSALVYYGTGSLWRMVVAFPSVSLKLTHKTALLIIVPLCVQLIFVAVLLVNLGETERESEAEARSNLALSRTNVVFNDALSAGGAIATGRAMRDQRSSEEFKRNLRQLEIDRDKLANLPEADPTQAKQVQTFISLIDETKDILVQASDMGKMDDAFVNLRGLAKLTSFIRRINDIGKELIGKRTEEHERYRQEQVASRQRLKTVIEIGSCLDVVLALTMAMILNRIFAQRMQVLMWNTNNIAMGRPLEERLQGTDELATLDNVIHNLSSDLVISRQKERATIENAAEIICSLDQRLRIIQINPAVRILGYSSDFLLGTALLAIVHEDDKNSVYESLDKCKSNPKDITFEARFRTKQGQYLFMAVIARWSEQEKKIFCVAHDITERKESERLKADVLAMINHDLRSSLNSLGITLELLTDGHLGVLSEKGARMIAKADGSVKVLQSMIDDLIEIDRIESRSFILDCRVSSLAEITQQAVDLMFGWADSKKIKIVIDARDLYAQVDAPRLRRVILNLLNNAIKFSPKESTVFISCREIAGQVPKHEEIEVRVIDQGAGIPPDKAEFIFQKFKQLERGGEGEQQGSGLGLAICKAIVDAHGGKVGVEATKSGGSSFWFRIPMRQADMAVEPVIESEAASETVSPAKSGEPSDTGAERSPNQRIEKSSELGILRPSKPAIETSSKPGIERSSKPEIERSSKPGIERSSEPGPKAPPTA
jgi:PAS domain S-box-containing protein